MLDKTHPYCYVDNDIELELESSHSMSICFNYLLLYVKNHVSSSHIVHIIVVINLDFIRTSLAI